MGEKGSPDQVTDSKAWGFAVGGGGGGWGLCIRPNSSHLLLKGSAGLHVEGSSRR